ncbi:DUF1835 domain-containing protein [Paenibacillus lentus]|uniref:DUF1835 domain-containing protein n=1 Tax=Paenibacillus lentus TaxID=1338368 RepID=A0A3S8RYB9_9BACL|nr:DUF1835 domain-containing protein [Paenibacillus lentus]AZK47923.1 DUF1835 domain-containing protein [Paenibacillus lentus]
MNTKQLDHIGADEAKAFLRFILAEIKLLKEQKESHETAVANLIEYYDDLMRFQEKRTFWDPVPNCTHVHIAFGDSFSGSIRQALKALGWADTHKMITFGENYAIGPLRDLDALEGRKARSDWFRDNITDAYIDYTEFEEEYNELLNKLEHIPKQAKVIVWTGNSVIEQVGMRHALYLLRGSSNTIAVYDTCEICKELYRHKETTIVYMYSKEIPSDRLQEVFLRVDDCSNPSTDINRLAEEWKAITEQGEVLRIWREDAVIGVPDDYYDQYLLEKLDKISPPVEGNGFIKAARVIGEALGYCDQYIGDSYFEYRLRELIYKGVLEIKGVPAAMRYYSVRRKGKTKISKDLRKPSIGSERG